MMKFLHFNVFKSKPEFLIIALFVVAKLTLNSIANSFLGLDGDEVMHIDSGNHLAFGFFSFQPLIGLFAWVQNLFNSESLFVHHLFSNLAAGIIIIYLGLITIELGGSLKTVLLCLTCYIVAPAFGMTHFSFQPNVFDNLFWIMCFYFLIRFTKTEKLIYIVYLAVAAALGFMSKLSIVFFLTGALIAFVIFKPGILKKKSVLLAILLFFILISPNIYWQIKNHYPFIFHMLKLKKEVLNDLSFYTNVKSFVFSLNILTIFVWFTGLFVVPFSSEYKHQRLVSFTALFSFSLLILSRGLHSYFFPLALYAFCFGSVYITSLLEKQKIVVTLYTTLLLVSGIYFIPQGIPLMSLDNYIRYSGIKKQVGQSDYVTAGTKIGMIDKSRMQERYHIDCEAYYSKDDWEQMVLEIKNIYDSLPSDERKNWQIFSDCYTLAGAINLYGEKYKLPKAFSYHASYFAWTPEFDSGVNVIFIDNSFSIETIVSKLSQYRKVYNSVQLKKNIYCRYAKAEVFTYIHILECKGLKYNSRQLKILCKDRVFNYPPLKMCEKEHILSLFGKSCIACKIEKLSKAIRKN